MVQPINTDKCATSTTRSVDYVLDFMPKRRYRRRMARRKDIEKIPGIRFQEARQDRDLTQEEAAAHLGVKQQTIDKIERGETKGGGTKILYANFLHLELQPSRDNGKTTISLHRALVDVSRPYDLPLFEPRGDGGGYMSVPKQASSLISRPHVLEDPAHSHAIKMVGTTMVPRYGPNYILYVDQTLPPHDGEGHVFYSADRKRALVRVLLRSTADNWTVLQHFPQKESVLPKKVWPICERIMASQAPR